MDIEKNLALTMEPDFLLKDHFIYNQNYAELFVYEDYVVFLTQSGIEHLHFH